MKKNADTLIWTPEAEQRLTRAPAGFMRNASRERVESYAREHGVSEITFEICEAALANVMSMMGAMFGAMGGRKDKQGGAKACPFDNMDQGNMSACPFNPDDAADRQDGSEQEENVTIQHSGVTSQKSNGGAASAAQASQKCAAEAAPPEHVEQLQDNKHKILTWTEEGEARMQSVPAGFMRDLTRKRVEAFARRTGVKLIDNALIDAKYEHWGKGSAGQHAEMAWEDEALARVQRIPDFVRGMVIKEIERCAREIGSPVVGQAALDRASHAWEVGGTFHSDMFPNQYKSDA